MSFDVHVQRFVDGEAARADGTFVGALLAPHVARTDPNFDFAELRFDDGTADLYGIDDPGGGFMVNHVSSQQAWALLADVAVRAGMTVMPAGAAPMIATEAMRMHLPDGLAHQAVVVTSATDILRCLAEG
ncbi:hypothetical protein CELL_02017 [Cellulomonas sp. T2.31MG-18]|uniref:hypothetical protein n=1 Tax=Cellulomonas sp. T2.31MG-18 TaxID=3157619 RepID=UPI0035EAFCDA